MACELHSLIEYNSFYCIMFIISYYCIGGKQSNIYPRMTNYYSIGRKLYKFVHGFTKNINIRLQHFTISA